jgi:hypothetical protein
LWYRATPLTLAPIAVTSSPLLAALRKAGTSHVYGDTADADDLQPVLSMPGSVLVAEVDGNTVNQPLVRRVLDRYLAGNRLRQCAVDLSTGRQALSPSDLAPYTIEDRAPRASGALAASRLLRNCERPGERGT